MMEIYYISSSFQKFVFNNSDVKIKELNLHEYEFSLDDNAKTFKRNEVNIPIVLYFYGPISKRKKMLEEFHRTIAPDRVSRSTGKLYFGEYYLEGNFIKEKIIPSESVDVTINEVMFFSKKPYWVKEKNYHFEKEMGASGPSKKYNNKYPYKYKSSLEIKELNNKHYVDTNFIMRIYGPCANPSVKIGGTAYTVYTTLQEKERLEINSRDKTIIKVDSKGNRINEFDKREKQRNFFKLIPPGKQDVIFGDYVFEIVLFEERSIPKWN